MFEILTYPFMQRALIAGIISGVLLGWIGVFVTSRQMSFIGDGIAHASLAAIALAILLGWSPLPIAIIFAILAAIVLYIIDQYTSISQDAAIGILFTAGLALGVVLLQFHDGYVPDLVSFLFGNILAVQTSDLITISIVAVIISLLLAANLRQFLFITVDPEGASLTGIRNNLIELALYIITAVAVVLSVKIIGIVLVSGLLIIPSATTKGFVKSFNAFQIATIVISILNVAIGLTLSVVLDWPSGATIILWATAVFVISRIMLVLRQKKG